MNKSTNTPALADWLLAQIAADEKNELLHQADAMTGWRWKGYPEAAYNELQDTARDAARLVLATCVAHRKIVELHTPLAGEECDPACGDIYPACATLRALAAIYRGRPGWQEDWA